MARPTKAELEAAGRALAAEAERRTGRKVASVTVTWTETTERSTRNSVTQTRSHN